jgi:hypothetical protein
MAACWAPLIVKEVGASCSRTCVQGAQKPQVKSAATSYSGHSYKWFMLQHPVPDKILAKIGDVTVSFAMLESQIQSFTGSLVMEHQRVGQIITAELPFRSLRALTVSLYLDRHGEDGDCAELRELMRRAAVLEDQRNQITHSVWGAGDTADTVTRIKMTAKEKRGAQFKFVNTGADDLGKLANDMKILANDVQRFGIELIEAGKAVNSPFTPYWGPAAPNP